MDRASSSSDPSEEQSHGFLRGSNQLEEDHGSSSAVVDALAAAQAALACSNLEVQDLNADDAFGASTSAYGMFGSSGLSDMTLVGTDLVGRDTMERADSAATDAEVSLSLDADRMRGMPVAQTSHDSAAAAAAAAGDTDHLCSLPEELRSRIVQQAIESVSPSQQGRTGRNPRPDMDHMVDMAGRMSLKDSDGRAIASASALWSAGLSLQRSDSETAFYFHDDDSHNDKAHADTSGVAHIRGHGADPKGRREDGNGICVSDSGDSESYPSAVEEKRTASTVDAEIEDSEADVASVSPLQEARSNVGGVPSPDWKQAADHADTEAEEEDADAFESLPESNLLTREESVVSIVHRDRVDDLRRRSRDSGSTDSESDAEILLPLTGEERRMAADMGHAAGIAAAAHDSMEPGDDDVDQDGNGSDDSLPPGPPVLARQRGVYNSASSRDQAGSLEGL